MSGSACLTHSIKWGIRIFMEFTFQVAIFMEVSGGLLNKHYDWESGGESVSRWKMT
jgi:hypothetical protein